MHLLRPDLEMTIGLKSVGYGEPVPHCGINCPFQHFQFSPVEDTQYICSNDIQSHITQLLTLMTFNTKGSSSGLQLHTRNGKINLKFSTSNSLLSYESQSEIYKYVSIIKVQIHKYYSWIWSCHNWSQYRVFNVI